MRTSSILVTAAIVMGVSQNAYAVTVLAGAAWARAGFGSAGDRCLDKILLDLKAGDTVEILTPTLAPRTAMNRVAEFTAPRRPGVRAAVLIAARRLLNRILASVAPADWPSLARILVQLAATPHLDQRRANRYVVVGALTDADPPAIDLALQHLLGGRRITVVALSQANTARGGSRLEAWRRFFATAGVAQLQILQSSAVNKTRAIDCSGRWLQVLDH